MIPDRLAKARVLGDWPEEAVEGPVIEVSPDGPVSDIQTAIDLCLTGRTEFGTARRVIRIVAGFYPGPVVIPEGAPPLTLRGDGPREVIVAARIDAQMPGEEYARRFGPRIRAMHRDSRAHFERIAAREVISTGNSGVLTVLAEGCRIEGMTLRNDYACDRAAAAPEGASHDMDGRFAEGQHQAVALHVAADRVALHNVHLSSFQDTLYLQAPQGRPVPRFHVSDSVIEGDVDFIFGGATAFFEGCEVRSRGARGASNWATAPSTALSSPYGFVFHRCAFRHDGTEACANGGCRLGRQWFEGVRASPYTDPEVRLTDRSFAEGGEKGISRRTLEAVGKCALVACEIGRHINREAPWDDWGAPGSERHRPVQPGSDVFLGHLQDWLRDRAPGFERPEPSEPWLEIIDCRWL